MYCKKKGYIDYWFLQQGAKLVQSAEDILVEFDGGHRQTDSELSAHSHGQEPNIDSDARNLLQAIDVYPRPRNELIAATTLGPAKVSELLLLLELEGLVEVLPGDEIRRIGG